MPVHSRPVSAPPPPVPVSAAKRITWTSAAGAVIDLSNRDGGYAILAGREGFGPVDAELVSDRMWDGSALLRNHRPQPRVMTTPLLVEGPDAETYLARLRTLQASFRHPVDPTTMLPTPGKITVEVPDGTKRSIAAYYQGGGSLTEDELDDVLACWGMLPNLQWYAPVPTWEGDQFTQTWKVAPAGAGVPPMPPVLLSPSSVIGAVTVTNPGDADAYPIWTITGPGTPTITNSDTGEQYAFTQPIPAGYTVTVDCRPVELAPLTGLTAIDNTAADWWPNLADYPAFWVLPPGQTNISMVMAGATSDSSIELTYNARWQAAW